jgi:TolA-binding protein
MSDALQNIELIERYFDNEMSDQEKNAFMERMKSDLELRHLFDREQLLVNTVRFTAAKNNIDFLKDLDRTLPAVSVDSKPTRTLSYAIAASLALLIAVSAYIYYAGAADPAELYASHFSPYPNVVEPTVRGADNESLSAQTFRAYEEGNFSKAADGFAKLLALLPDRHKEAHMLLLLGNCNMALNRIPEAKRNFENCMQRSTELTMEASWYLGLCNLKEGNTEQAKALFRDVARTDTDYQAAAKELLDKLD